jgi:peptidoglycan hydrolase-like protein with peptidoglycan-binding domain
MDQFRRDVSAYLAGDAPPPPEPEDVETETVTLELPVLRVGDSGEAVSRMQHLLAAAGFMDEANVSNYDGVWGNGTDAAKQRFDAANDLLPSPPTDCGPASWRALLGNG